MDKDEEIKRQSKLTNALYEERDKYQKSLNQLQASFKDEEDKIKENFFQFSEQINLQRETLEKEIQEYEDKQKKIIARFKQDEEIRQQRDFYHIKIDSAAQQDIYKLKNLALEFSKPEALYKILYEVYYKTKTNELFDRILGDKKDCGGIYKITNITNEKVYVGRTVNFKKRWIEHIKRGCNIDRISGKIYDAMFSEGIENFSFEIVEVCSKEEQAEKEKYWINFYKAMEYGYNSKAGG
jgi:membrane-associated HD superfamily phosphohydrolase